MSLARRVLQPLATLGLLFALLAPLQLSHAQAPSFESISGLNEVARKYWIHQNGEFSDDIEWVMIAGALVFGFDSPQSAANAYDNLGGNAPDLYIEHIYIPQLEDISGEDFPGTVTVENRSDNDTKPTSERSWSWTLDYHQEAEGEEYTYPGVVSIAQSGSWVVIASNMFAPDSDDIAQPESFSASASLIVDEILAIDESNAVRKFPDEAPLEGTELDASSERIYQSEAMVANVTATAEAFETAEAATAQAIAMATEDAIASATAEAQAVVENAPGGLIAFVGSDDNIWLMQPDGTELTQLTTSGNAATPSWSHDGTMLTWSEIAPTAFFNHQIMLLNNGAIRAIPDTDADCRVPVFNADDTEIIFTCNEQDNNTNQTRGMLNAVSLSSMRVVMFLEHPTLGAPDRWGHVIHIDVRESDGAILTVREESSFDSRNTWTVTVYDSSYQVIEDDRAAAVFGANWLSSGQWNFSDADEMYSIVQNASGSIGIGTIDATGKVTLFAAPAVNLRSSFVFDEASGYMVFSGDAGGVFLADATGSGILIAEDGTQFSWQPAEAEIALP